MASRVNVKFVVILCIVLGAVSLGVAAAAAMVILKSGQDYIRIGDARKAEGDLAGAQEAYSRAVAKDRSNVEWLETWLSTLREWTPPTETEYRNEFDVTVRNILFTIAKLKGSDVDAWDEYLDLRYQYFIISGATSETWTGFLSEVQLAIDTIEYRATTDDWEWIRRYRGLALVELMRLDADLLDEQPEQAKEDLEATLAQRPDDHIAATGLLDWYVWQIQQAMSDGREDDARAHEAEGFARAKEFIDSNPGNPYVAVFELHRRVVVEEAKATRGLVGPAWAAASARVAEAHRDELPPIGQALLSTPVENLDYRVMQQFLALERYLFKTADAIHAEAVIQRYVETRPDDTTARMILAASYRDRNQFEEARAQYDRIIETPIPALSLKGVLGYSNRVSAELSKAQLAWMEWRRSMQTKDDDARQAAIESLKSARDAYEEYAASTATPLLLLDAQIAFAEDDPIQALATIKEYNEARLNRDPEGVWLWGYAALARNQFGEAREAFRLLRQMQPTNVQALQQLGQIEERLMNLDQALVHWDELQALVPDNEAVNDKVRELRKRTFREVSDDPIEAALLEAKRMLSGSAEEPPDPEGAIRSLEEAMNTHGDAPAIALELAMVYLVRERIEEARIALDRGLAVQSDHEELSRIREALETDDIVEASVKVVESTDESDLGKHLRIYQIYRDAGRMDQALDRLAQASAIAPTDHRVLEFQFVEAFRAEDVTEAERVARVASEENIDRADGLTFRARVEILKENRQLAIEMLEEAASSGSVGASTYALIGRQYVQLGNEPAAMAAFEQSLAMRPSDSRVINEYIDVLVRSGQYQQALQTARDSELYGRNNPMFQAKWLDLESRFGDRQFALERREAMLSRDPSNLANKASLAALYIEMGRWDNARTLLDQLLVEAPSLEVTRLDATWYAEQGDIQGATDAFSLFIVEQEEPNAGPFLALGQFLLQYNQIEDSLTAFQQARDFQGEERRADKAMGEALMYMGRADDALGIFKDLVDAGADDESSSYLKRVIEMLLQTEQWDEAEAYLAKVPQENRTDLTVMLQRAALARGRGDVIASRRLLDDAVATHDTSPFAFFRRATMLAKDLGAHPEYEPDVMSDFEEAIRLQPGYWQALEARGEVHRQLGQIDRCVADWRAALRVNPTNEKLRARTMVFLVDRGRPGEAAEVAQEAIDVRPGDRELILGSATLFQRYGDHERAAQFFAQAWQIDQSRNVGLAYLQSLIAIRPVRTTDALAVLNRLGRETVEQDPLLLMIRAVVLVARRELEPAKRDVLLAFELHHDQPLQREQWFGQLRTVYPEHGERLAAIRDLETRTRDTTWATFYRARELLTQDASRADGQTLLQSLMNEGDTALALLTIRSLAGSYYGEEQFEDALGVWETGLERFPDDWELHNNIAYTLSEHLNRASEALTHAESAVQLAPGRAVAFDTLGNVRMHLGEHEAAEAALTESLRLARSEQERLSALLQLAEVMLEVPNRQRAATYVNQAETILNSMVGVREADKERLDQLKAQLDSPD